jgi:hypothetical protein
MYGDFTPIRRGNGAKRMNGPIRVVSKISTDCSSDNFFCKAGSITRLSLINGLDDMAFVFVRRGLESRAPIAVGKAGQRILAQLWATSKRSGGAGYQEVDDRTGATADRGVGLRCTCIANETSSVMNISEPLRRPKELDVIA